jgi:PKD repeat protein
MYEHKQYDFGSGIMLLRKLLFTIILSCLFIGLAAASPTAYFSYDIGTGGAPLTVAFSDLSTGGTVSSWSWDFGDGNTSTLQNPTHTYVTVGTYTVTLTINGGVSTATGYHVITVTTIPTANFAMSTTSGIIPLTVNFTDLSTGVPASWSWDFGDGASSTAQNPSHTYNTAGYYTVSLTALDNSGQGSTKTVASAVMATQTAAVPSCVFQVSPTTGQAPLYVSFTDMSTGVPSSWSWDFGDGSTSTTKNPVHTYTNPGLYTVSLIVSNSFGTDSYTAASCIAASGASSVITGSVHSSFSVISSSNSSLPITVQFQDTSTGSPVNWSWAFGDGTNSTEQNPTHVYNTVGTYLVTLQVMNSTASGSTSQMNVTPMIAAPHNYSKYVSQVFTSHMTTWDFVEHTKNFYLDFIPADYFWAIILLIPYITMYNRQGTFILIGVLYLFTGGIVAVVMPAFLAPVAFWFLIIGSCGLIFRLFVPE